MHTPYGREFEPLQKSWIIEDISPYLKPSSSVIPSRHRVPWFHPGINEFMDLPGIAEQIREITDILCGRNYLSIVWFPAVTGDLYSGTVVAQGSNSVPGCALINEKYMHIFRRSKSVRKVLHALCMLVLEGKRIYNMGKESGMASIWDF